MCFRTFYTNIYNIHLSFIKIERKTGIEEVRAKPAKKTGSPRRVVCLGEASLRLGRVDRGQKMVSGLPRPSAIGLETKIGHFYPILPDTFQSKQNKLKTNHITQLKPTKNTFMEELGFS